MSEPVYVVIRSTGEYSDRYETVLGYFSNEKAAQEFCLGAEREWKEAAVLFPLPQYPSGLWGADEYETVYPNKEIRRDKTEFGTVVLCTPDYTQGRKVPRTEAERAQRKAAKDQYSAAYSAAQEGRLAHVSLDTKGGEEDTWYYEKAECLDQITR